MTDKKIFLLTGWGRYLASDSIERLMEQARRYRAEDGLVANFGIAVQDDEWALVWQRLNFRLHRARKPFLPVSRSYSFSGTGPLTLSIAPGIPIPGWEDDPIEGATARSKESFDKNYRQKAVRAKAILIMRHGEALGAPLTGLLDERSYQETMREAID